LTKEDFEEGWKLESGSLLRLREFNFVREEAPVNRPHKKNAATILFLIPFDPKTFDFIFFTRSATCF